MEKQLVIVDVSSKQKYIFATKKLRDNIQRSEIIRYVTSTEFFEKAAGDSFSPQNIVYSGGGHTVLQFDTPAAADAFARRITQQAISTFDGLELVVSRMPYRPDLTPGQNLDALRSALAAKKAARTHRARRLSYGVEQLDPDSMQPCRAAPRPVPSMPVRRPPKGFVFPDDIIQMVGRDNFYALVHLDGNGMGKRLQAINRKNADSWDKFCAGIQTFSAGIQRDFTQTFDETVQEIIDKTGAQPNKNRVLPIRPVVLAGDDVCFITRGDIGLECARIFLEKLSHKKAEDGLPYAACAGVMLVHSKYPFYQAYAMTEQLCSNAKKFGAEYDPEGRISAMDWHMEFGQLQDDLATLRKDYETDDGARLELRPVAVVVPPTVKKNPALTVRSYQTFRSRCMTLQKYRGRIARGKMKNLRQAGKQGRLESKFFIKSRLLKNQGMRIGTDREAGFLLRELLPPGQTDDIFAVVDGVPRCLVFDAIEMMDHCDFTFQGGKA